MKNFLLFLIFIIVVACNKYSENKVSKVDSTKIVDSINDARTKINDSIINSQKYIDLEGTHVLTHDMIKGNGKITFKKINQNQYEVSGKLTSGKNYLTIEGTSKMTSPKNLKLDGEIKQRVLENDNGKLDIRSGKLNFFTKDGGRVFQLYEAVNSSGFADKILIKI